MKSYCMGALLALALTWSAAGAQEPDMFYQGVQAYRARDYDGAATWFAKAAELGDGDAQFLLGRMHYDGNSLTVDYVTAYQWFAIAADSGVGAAPRYRDGLALKMKDEEIAEGKKRAEAWLAKFQRKP